jgi:hypothetical protein
MIKKIFFISLFFFVLFGIILLAYNFSFQKNPTNPVASDSETKELDAALEENNQATAPTVSGKMESILNEDVLGAHIGPGGALYYYSQSDEALKKTSFEGKDKVTLMSNLPGKVERVVWSPKRDGALVAFRQGANLRWHTVFFATKTLVPLKPEVSRATWSQGGESIYYLFTNQNKERFLDTASPDGSNFRTLTALGALDHFIEVVPQSNRASFWTRPNGLGTTIFGSITKEGQDKKTLLEGRYGADYLWSPSSKKIAFSTVRESGSSDLALGLMNENGGEIRDLGIPTFVSKAVWSGDSKTLYYALPGGIPKESVLPDDYYRKPIYTSDTFWKVDTETGQKTRLLELEEGTSGIDSEGLFLSSKEDYLFFTDRKTKKLYRLEI